MKESDIKVSDEMLAEYWFKSALDSLEGIKKAIIFFNQTYNFNLYNDEEDLPPEKINLKVNIKYTNVSTPLAYVAELFLKSIIISDAQLNNSNNFNRNDAVRQLMKNVKSQFKSNAHNLTALVEYINKNIDDNFKIDLASIYRNHRSHCDSSYTRTMSFLPRIEYATRLYENAFINARYLYETQDILTEHIDLVKLIDYVNTLRDCCYLQLIKIKLSKFDNFKDYIKEYYNNRTIENKEDLIEMDGRDVYRCLDDLLVFIEDKFIQTLEEKQGVKSYDFHNDEVNKILDEFCKIKDDCKEFYDSLSIIDDELEGKIEGKSEQNIYLEQQQLAELVGQHFQTQGQSRK